MFSTNEQVKPDETDDALNDDHASNVRVSLPYFPDSRPMMIM